MVAPLRCWQMNLYLRHLDSSKGDKMGGMGKMMGGDKQDASKNLSPEEQAEASVEGMEAGVLISVVQVASLMTAMHSNLTTVAMKNKKYKVAVKEATNVRSCTAHCCESFCCMSCVMSDSRAVVCMS